MSTALSSTSAYCTVAQMVTYHDWRQLGDLINDNSTRATESEVGASTLITTHLKAASGMIEAACLKGGRYTPTDLGTTLSGVSQNLLQKLTADLAWWSLYSRRFPQAQMTPAAMWAYQQLDALEQGKEIFGFSEHAAAGQPKDDFMTQADYDLLGLATDAAKRYFGRRAKIRRLDTVASDNE